MRISVRHGLLGLALVLTTVPVVAAGSGQFKDLLNKVKSSTQHRSNSSLGSNLPDGDIASGLKEALAKGTTNAINSLGRDGGFWNNSKVRIPLPGKLEQAGKLARQLGQGARVDAFELSMNRAAEKAVPQVAQIFGDAIRKMTLSDARGILTGGDHAATDFFRRVAGDALTARIHPIVAERHRQCRRHREIQGVHRRQWRRRARRRARFAGWSQVEQRRQPAGSGRLRDGEDAGRPVHRNR